MRQPNDREEELRDRSHDVLLSENYQRKHTWSDTMLVVTGSVTARQDTFEELRAEALAHVRRSRNEPGCLSHAVHVDCENPLRLVFVEEWESRDALLTHFAVPESRAFVKSARALAVESSPIGIFDANRIEKL